MSEVVQDTPQEFWRPPSRAVADEIILRETVPAMAQACQRCGTEFLLGSGYCHACGNRRSEVISTVTEADSTGLEGLWARGVDGLRTLAAELSWNKVELPAWLRYLHFHEMKSRIGLSTASFIAFVIGVGCIAGALLVGLLTARNLVDWQAIQFYRAEWLIGATASFVAGILLKKPVSRNRD